MDTECCVCLEITDTKTSCGHYLCVQCFSKLYKNSCPMCRNENIGPEFFVEDVTPIKPSTPSIINEPDPVSKITQPSPPIARPNPPIARPIPSISHTRPQVYQPPHQFINLVPLGKCQTIINNHIIYIPIKKIYFVHKIHLILVHQVQIQIQMNAKNVLKYVQKTKNRARVQIKKNHR